MQPGERKKQDIKNTESATGQEKTGLYQFKTISFYCDVFVFWRLCCMERLLCGRGDHLFNLFCIPNKVVTEFYEEYAVYYYEQEKDECFILFWEDIASWIYYPKMNDLDLIEIELKNHARICFKCLSKHKTMQYFQMFAPNKEKTKAKVRIL